MSASRITIPGAVMAATVVGLQGCAIVSEDWAKCQDLRTNPALQLSACSSIIDSGKETRSNLALAFNNRGVAYSNQGDLARAIADYDQAIRLDPSQAIAFNNRGVSYSKEGDIEQSIRDFDQAIELKPDFAEAYVNRSSEYYKKGEFDRAISDLN